LLSEPKTTNTGKLAGSANAIVEAIRFLYPDIRSAKRTPKVAVVSEAK